MTILFGLLTALALVGVVLFGRAAITPIWHRHEAGWSQGRIYSTFGFWGRVYWLVWGRSIHARRVGRG